MTTTKQNLTIECAGEELVLLAEKAVYWPRYEALIIADLHLGKPAAFRRAGLAVPESTTAEDLSRLDRLLRQLSCRRLIVLGDLVHARSGLQAEMLEAVAHWRKQHPGVELLLIPGNHDKRSGPTPENWQIRQVEERWMCPPFLFCHEPKPRADGYLLAGHIHPAFVLRERFGPGLRAPCFCFGPARAILPAFGSFTGMASIQPERGDRIFAIDAADAAVWEVPGRRR